MMIVKRGKFDWLCLDLNDTVPLFEGLARLYTKMEDETILELIADSVCRVAVDRKDIYATKWFELNTAYKLVFGEYIKFKRDDHFLTIQRKKDGTDGRHGYLEGKALKAFAKYDLDLHAVFNTIGRRIPAKVEAMPNSAAPDARLDARLYAIEKQQEEMLALLTDIDELLHQRTIHVVQGGKKE